MNLGPGTSTSHVSIDGSVRVPKMENVEDLVGDRQHNRAAMQAGDRGWVGAVVVPIRNGTHGLEVLLGQNPVVDLVKSTSFEPGADGE
jgi:hypothetical protein